MKSKLSEDSAATEGQVAGLLKTQAFGTPPAVESSRLQVDSPLAQLGPAPAPAISAPGGTLLFDPQAVNGKRPLPGAPADGPTVPGTPIISLSAGFGSGAQQDPPQLDAGAPATVPRHSAVENLAAVSWGAGGAHLGGREPAHPPAKAVFPEAPFQLATLSAPRRPPCPPLDWDVSAPGHHPGVRSSENSWTEPTRPVPPEAAGAPWADAKAPLADRGPFRENALRARFEGEATATLPQVTGSRWAALLLLCSLATVLSAVAYFGQVEVTSKALGSLRVAGGPRPITAQASGVISKLAVKAGDRVQANQVLARVEARELNARVERSSRQVDLLREEGQRAREASQALERKTIAALEQKRGLLWQRAKLKQEQLTARRGHATRMRELARQGAASGVEALTAEEAASIAQEELLSLRQQAAEIGVQIADRKHSYGADDIERAFRVREAEVGLAEAETLAVLGSVKASETGRVESLLVSEGQVVEAGAILARIIPDGQATSAVVFAPAKDAAFLKEGLDATLEFISLPVSEYGKAKARVTRVASDLAVPQEISDVLGAGPEAGAGLVRVEVAVVEDDTWKKMAPRLHSGARVIARLETRKRRIITLVFDFMRSWYPE